MKNLGKILREAQKMQQEMAKIQQELAQERIESSAGGGAVRVVVSGTQEILEVKISPEVVNPKEIEMLEDMILAALREALAKSRERAEAKLGRITAGLSIPGIF